MTDFSAGDEEASAAPQQSPAAGETAVTGELTGIRTEPRPELFARSDDAPPEVVVIGAGPGGYVAAIRAAQLGAAVVLVEQEHLGGTCLNCGCIPSKSLLETAEVLRTVQSAGDFGVRIEGGAAVDWAAMMSRKQRIVEQLRKGIAYLMKKNQVRVVAGVGRLGGEGQVIIEPNSGVPEEHWNSQVILATGSLPQRPDIPGCDSAAVVTSKEMLDLEQPLQSLVVIGGGVIGIELAYLHARLGASVTVLEMLTRILPTEDEDIGAEMERSLRRLKVDCRTGVTVREIVPHAGGAEVIYEQDDVTGRVSAERVLIATGRTANTEGLGLPEAGVETAHGRIIVDARMNTSLPDIYAIGDVVHGSGLAHLASAEGVTAAECALGEGVCWDRRPVPACIYTHPEIARVGMSEDEARLTQSDVAVSRFDFQVLGRAVAAGERRGFIKLIAKADTGALLGVHMIGPRVTDLIAEATLALSLEATADDLVRCIHAHPTFAEAIHEAALGISGFPLHGL